MSQWKIHRPYVFLGALSNGDFDVAIAIPLDDNLTLASISGQSNGKTYQLKCKLAAMAGQKSGLYRAGIQKINANDARGLDELEVLVERPDGSIVPQDYCNTPFAKAANLSAGLTLDTPLLLLLLQQVEWADNVKKDRFEPDVVFVGESITEGDLTASLSKDGNPPGPRVPTKPTKPSARLSNSDQTVNPISKVATQEGNLFESKPGEAGA